MTEKRILFEGFEFPMLVGLEYLVNEEISETDFLFVNERDDSFSMYFEKGFPVFTVPDSTDRDYCLFELKRQGRVIKFFCPEKKENLDTAVWYFYVEIYGDDGRVHILPGQVRVGFDGASIRRAKGRPSFIEVLERVKLYEKNYA